MADEEDRSELFNEIQKFSQRKLKKVETKVKTGLGDDVTEKRTAKGLATSAPGVRQQANAPTAQSAAKKLDLQVGLVTGGLMIGSNDVATSAKTLNEYGVTHVLNLCPNETEAFQFEDDFNYLAVQLDENVSQLKQVLDKCFDFIEEGQQRGSCFVHCSTAKPGLSRSTAICIAYLIYKDKKSYADAFNDVKEARAFVRPSDWFAKQLQAYATEQGAKAAEATVEDKFTAKKRREIEEEKALLQKAVNLQKKKNLWDSKAEESQKQQLNDQLAKEKLQQNKLRANPNAFEPDANEGGRKLTSLMSLFQQKEQQQLEPAKQLNKVVLNKAPAKKWAPVSTPHLQRTVKPETKNYDFYKRAKSREFKKQESLRKSKSKLNTAEPKPTTDLNNNSRTSAPMPPPPPPPPPAKSVPNNVAANAKRIQPAAAKPIPPPPPPPPAMAKPIPSNHSIVSNRVPSPVPSANSKTSSPMQSSVNSRVSSPQPSSNASSRVSSPPPPPPTANAALIRPANKPVGTLNNGLNSKAPAAVPPASPSATTQSKLDPFIMNKFNKSNDRNQFCIDYGSKLQPNGPNKSINSVSTPAQSLVKKPAEQVVRNIPIKIEPKEEKEEEEEVVELEVEEESSEESSESEEESEEEEEEESEEETESEEESSESEESSEEESSSEEEEAPKEQPKTGLTRSSTQQILNLIKSKNNETLQAINEADEDREIDLLLNGLEKEGVENIDWSEFELSLEEIQEIINSNN